MSEHDVTGLRIILAANVPGITIAGGEIDQVPACTMLVEDGETVVVVVVVAVCVWS